MRLENKIAIVTGAASGLGKAIADLFVDEGAKVIYSDINEINDIKGQEFVKCDVSNKEEVNELVNHAVKKFGRLDIMVNNAGIASSGSLTETDDSTWDKTIAVNLSGTFYGMRAAGRSMKEKKVRGSIINIGSIAGEVGFKDTLSYCASKGGVTQMTRAAALDMAEFNIRVNVIAPGVIETNMVKDFLEDENFKKMVSDNTPLGRVGKSEDIAFVALYLASDESSFTTGETVKVDGGWTAR